MNRDYPAATTSQSSIRNFRTLGKLSTGIVIDVVYYSCMKIA